MNYPDISVPIRPRCHMCEIRYRNNYIVNQIDIEFYCLEDFAWEVLSKYLFPLIGHPWQTRVINDFMQVYLSEHEFPELPYRAWIRECGWPWNSRITEQSHPGMDDNFPIAKSSFPLASHPPCTLTITSWARMQLGQHCMQLADGVSGGLAGLGEGTPSFCEWVSTALDSECLWPVITAGLTNTVMVVCSRGGQLWQQRLKKKMLLFDHIFKIHLKLKS